MGVIRPTSLAKELRRLVGLRNLLVHRYRDVDDARVCEEAVSGGIDNVEEFVKEIREYLKQQGVGRGLGRRRY